MKRRRRQRIKLSDEEREVLQGLVSKHTEKQAVALRARVMLLADDGKQHQEIAKELGIRKNTVTTWLVRWPAMVDKPAADRLQDLPRCGAPLKFSPEQICQIISIACEDPSAHGRPITQWTHRELADVVLENLLSAHPDPYVFRL